MKKVLTIAATFILFFIVMASLLYLMNLDNVNSITEIIITSLLTDVVWHIVFYIVMPRLRKNNNAWLQMRRGPPRQGAYRICRSITSSKIFNVGRGLAPALYLCYTWNISISMEGELLVQGIWQASFSTEKCHSAARTKKSTEAVAMQRNVDANRFGAFYAAKIDKYIPTAPVVRAELLALHIRSVFYGFFIHDFRAAVSAADIDPVLCHPTFRHSKQCSADLFSSVLRLGRTEVDLCHAFDCHSQLSMRSGDFPLSEQIPPDNLYDTGCDFKSGISGVL